LQDAEERIYQFCRIRVDLERENKRRIAIEEDKEAQVAEVQPSSPPNENEDAKMKGFVGSSSRQVKPVRDEESITALTSASRK